MKYRTIVADPPWEYERFPVTRSSGADHNVLPGPIEKRAEPYPLMSFNALKFIGIGEWAEDDSRLFLWTTNRYLPNAFDLLRVWSFDYRQTLVWHKAEGGPFAGSVAPNTAEFLLVAVRGHPGRLGTLPSSVIYCPPKRIHSAKPEAFLDYIEQISPGPYLELFARRNRLGWDTWGNESLEHVGLIRKEELA